MDKDDKLDRLLSDRILREITIKEMGSRLRAYIIACHFGLIDDGTALTFSKLNDIYLLNPKYNNRCQIFKLLGYSKFNSMLLVWSSLTGEMRNHQSLAAHVDGNKSHCMETLSLFPRYNNDEQMPNENLNKDCDGSVLFPLDGLIIKYLAGLQLLHCSLSNTLHLSDSSRNTTNWSCVHGP